MLMYTCGPADDSRTVSDGGRQGHASLPSAGAVAVAGPVCVLASSGWARTSDAGRNEPLLLRHEAHERRRAEPAPALRGAEEQLGQVLRGSEGTSEGEQRKGSSFGGEWAAARS